MSEFSPRIGKSGYVKKRGKHRYYRRSIPVRFRYLFGGKTEWMIKLEGKTEATWEAEAMALAHIHNRQMALDMSAIVTTSVNPLDGTQNIRVDFSPDFLPLDRRVPEFEFYRDGRLIKTYKFAGSNDPDFLREAERDGFFAMSGAEFREQAKLGKFRLAHRNAPNPDAKELAKLKTKIAAKSIDDLAPVRGDTLRSILPKMHKQKMPKQPTRNKHMLAANEFIALHGNLPLLSITRQHVADFVDHVGDMMTHGKKMAPTTVRQRLDTIAAILQFAMSIDAIPFNPAKSVTAPRDSRPFASKVYKALDKSEVEKLVTVAADKWGKRRYQTAKTQRTRKTDFLTALDLLMWTGARPEEICQLRLADIEMERMSLTITNIEEDDDLRDRFVKNEHSVRVVPIHSFLKPRLEAHLAHIKDSSNGALLFPSFEPELESGRYARPISQEWTTHLRQHITNDPQKVLYSLRHSWAAESRRVGMPEWVRNLIMGHANKEASQAAGRYGASEDNLEIKREWLEKMVCVQAPDHDSHSANEAEK
ncbi:MAG: tyrosine-type recombinase/integrase [Sulfitobacter sp.]